MNEDLIKRALELSDVAVRLRVALKETNEKQRRLISQMTAEEFQFVYSEVKKGLTD